jgi:hypothetical protein
VAQAVTDLSDQDAPAFAAAVTILFQLLKAEMAEREIPSIAQHIKAEQIIAYEHRLLFRSDLAFLAAVLSHGACLWCSMRCRGKGGAPRSSQSRNAFMVTVILPL